MTRYLLSVYQPGTGERPPAEVLERISADLDAIHEDLRAAGSWVFAGGLAGPSTATVVHAKDDEVLLTDGPYLEGKEYLGGFAIIEADDLDAALAWARRFAKATTLPIEVQPFLG
jgi:hypothetical protein